MSTVFVASVVIAIVVIFCLAFITASKWRNKKKLSGLLKHFSKLGTSHNLSFTSQEVLADKIIGLDGPNRKVLVLEKKLNEVHSYVIDISQVQDCLFNKTERNYVCTIGLAFRFKNENAVIDLCFYNSMVNSIYELQMLESKARHWESILSKLLTKDKKRA